MPRNTFLLVSLLAIFAALVIGVNIGKRFGINPPAPTAQSTPKPTSEPTPTPMATATYTNKSCGISFDYPQNFIKQEASESAGAIFVDPKNTSSASGTIIFACQKDIPRVPLPPEKIETIQIASISAKLYHDTSAKDGSPIDKLIFYLPKKGMDVFLAGLGPTFQQAIASLKIL